MYSLAAGYKKEYVFRWNGVNDMPQAQLDDLILLYQTGDGKCQLTFDGATTWIDVQLVRSAEFLFTEIEELPYSEDSVNTPVNELRFRESL